MPLACEQAFAAPYVKVGLVPQGKHSPYAHSLRANWHSNLAIWTCSWQPLLDERGAQWFPACRPEFGAFACGHSK